MYNDDSYVTNYYYNGDILADTVGQLNPIRYRGYYYDSETGFYFLSSRYYAPELCRFISSDAYVSTGQGILGNNMFAYCGNNPVVYSDSTGTFRTYSVMMTDGGSAPAPIKAYFTIKNCRNVGNGNKNTIPLLGVKYSETETYSQAPIWQANFAYIVQIENKTSTTLSSRGTNGSVITVYADRDIERPLIYSSAGILFRHENCAFSASISSNGVVMGINTYSGNTTQSFGVQSGFLGAGGVYNSFSTQFGQCQNTTCYTYTVNPFSILILYCMAVSGLSMGFA